MKRFSSSSARAASRKQNTGKTRHSTSIRPPSQTEARFSLHGKATHPKVLLTRSGGTNQPSCGLNKELSATRLLFPPASEQSLTSHQDLDRKTGCVLRARESRCW